jgi:hypothetical protein
MISNLTFKKLLKNHIFVIYLKKLNFNKMGKRIYIFIKSLT